MLTVCLNGGRSAREGVPVTPSALGAAAAAAVQAGASAVHVHPRDLAGRESLSVEDICLAVAEIRAAAPFVPVGVSTHERICPDPGARLGLLHGWPSPEEGGPDFASVNWHEPGALRVAGLLRSRGIGVEAGIWTPRAASQLVGTQWPWQVERVLVEVLPGHTPGSDGVWAAERILAALGRVPSPVLVHGEEAWSWPVLQWAARRGYGTRIGMEDTLTDQRGRRVRSNTVLVAQAAGITPGAGAVRGPS